MAIEEYKLGNQFLFNPKKSTLVSLDESSNTYVLGTNESRLLLYLIKNKNRTVSRKELMDTLWNDREIFVDDSSLTQCVSTLRKALSDSSKEPQYIKTIPKLGYGFIAETDQHDEYDFSEIHSKHPIDEKESIRFDAPIVGLIRPHLLVLNSLLVRLELFIVIVVLTLFLSSAV